MKAIGNFILYWIVALFDNVYSLLMFLIIAAFIIAACLDTCSTLFN